jgi:hypothetical protein
MTAILEKPALKESYTSTGSKFFYHEEAMRKLSNGQGMPITTHCMLTDVCQHTCAFCSVLTRDGHSLALKDVEAYLDILCKRGLKAVILSGGGNPILYRDKATKRTFDDAVAMIAGKGLEIGLITNGMPMKDYYLEYPRLNNGRTCSGCGNDADSCTEQCKETRRKSKRTSWRNVSPETLDKFKWIRISMSGLDHAENEVFVPDIDPTKTTLGFSYVYHDSYDCPEEKNHGKVSTIDDLIRLTPGNAQERVNKIYHGNEGVRWGADRIETLKEQIGGYVEKYKPRYVRLLPNCLEPSLIDSRCRQLQYMADQIDPQIVFVQNKPPRAPHACFLGYVHPVLNSDGYVYPCDSVVLNEAANHKFANPWRVCHWSEVDRIYSEPVRSLVDPQKLCPGCVFSGSNDLLERVVNGETYPGPSEGLQHPNFV